MTMMSFRIQATIILITWGMLLALYVANKYLARITFLKAPIVVELNPSPALRPGSFLSGTGVLFAFVINIATIGLVFGCTLSLTFQSASSLLRFDLPLWIHVTGGILFVLYSLWGMLVLFFNPNYTPLYKKPRGRYVVVTEGPYRLVRHPRYEAAALANLIFFLFTGFWLSLFGILGWAAIYVQARAEEQFLLTLAPGEYAEYRRRTGMFFPRVHWPAKPGRS